MDIRQAKPLTSPLLCRLARACLPALLTAFVSVGASAQTDDGAGTRPPRDLNTELRTNAWSIYAQGGLSWATGVWYENIDAKQSYKLAPAVGGGIDFTIRPWVRVGAEYLWSRYRREQRLSVLETATMPVKTYGNYLVNYHNAKLGVGFNLLEFWPARRAQWLNVWIGTGAGYTFATGNEYGIYFSNTITGGGVTTPLTPDATISNESSVTLTGNVRTTNRHEAFDTFYLPATLHIEADLSRQFTVGLKGEMDWLFNRKEVAPENLIFALATVRYNFVPSRARILRDFYEGDLALLNDRVNALQREAAEAKALADREAADQAKLQEENADLQSRLKECEEGKTAVALSHFVQFDHNSSFMSRAEAERLKSFAQSVLGRKLSLTAEASTPGEDGYNQALSERRLNRVVEALIKEGFAPEDLHPQTAIGEQNGKPAGEGRRVTITVSDSK